jgi:F0F1-type ATP synthase membrane subunit c/vacuolar-type H+-ATPase subunit K
MTGENSFQGELQLARMIHVAMGGSVVMLAVVGVLVGRMAVPAPLAGEGDSEIFMPALAALGAVMLGQAAVVLVLRGRWFPAAQYYGQESTLEPIPAKTLQQRSIILAALSEGIAITGLVGYVITAQPVILGAGVVLALLALLVTAPREATWENLCRS